MIRNGFTYKKYGIPPCLVYCSSKILKDFLLQTKAYPTHREADKPVKGLKEFIENSRVYYYKSFPLSDKRYQKICRINREKVKNSLKIIT